MKRVGVIAISIAFAIALLTGCSSGPQYATKVTDNEQTNVTEDTSESVKAEHYSKAADLAAKGNYAEAIEEYKKANDYSDANEKIFKIYCSLAEKAQAEDKYDEAISNYQKASEYKDVSDKILAIYYAQGEKAFAAGEFDKAVIFYRNAGAYKDSKTRLSEIAYFCAEQALKNKDIKSAASYFSDAGDYKDAQIQAQKLYYNLGISALKNKNYEEGAKDLQSAGDYPAAKKLLDTTITNLIAQKDYSTAEKMAAYYEDSKVAGLKDYIQGRKAYSDGDYAAALLAFERAKDTKDTSLYIKASNYFLGVKALADKDFKLAQTYFSKGENYKNSQVLLNVCLAEENIAKNDYKTAATFYSKVPKSLKVNGINISARKSLMSRITAFSKIKGNYSVKSNRIQTTKRKYNNKKYKYYWYVKGIVSQQYLRLDYSVNRDGTINLSGTVCYYRYTNYSDYSASLKRKYETVSFNIRNLKSIPTNVVIGNHLRLKYKKGIFTVVYYEKYNYSQFNYHVYQTTVNFKKR
ncbi:MAG: hypothetical protein IJ819_06520 [Clostridiales bacterium]|nr:hypothetical protein [Clostridiales bacterium]